MLERLEETIVAISSPAGYADVGLVRLSGKGSIELAGRMSRVDGGLSGVSGSSRVLGEIEVSSGLTVPAWLHVFRAPRSYTRQDMVEVCTIGSPAVLAMVRDRAIELGARSAEPGEFTARAFFSGAIDLAQAEAVAGLIRAQSDVQLRAARRMMEGSLASTLCKIGDQLMELSALVEADIDFAEEPIEFIAPQQIRDRLADVSQRLGKVLGTAVSAERFDILPRILLIGPPNSGKSTLTNALSGTSRAICAEVAGTTRDILSVPVQLYRGEAILLDAAGIDDSPDLVIEQAREAALAHAEQVDLVCLVVDASKPEDAEFVDRLSSLDLPPVVVVGNKCDVLDRDAVESALATFEGWGHGRAVMVSATRGTGLGELRRRLEDALDAQPETVGNETILIGNRQRQAVAEAKAAVHRAIDLAAAADETSDCADVLAFELREAMGLVGSVTGEVTTEDLLSHVFSNFCIGK